MKIFTIQDAAKLELYHILVKDPKNYALVRKSTIKGARSSLDKDEFNHYSTKGVAHNVKLKAPHESATSIIDDKKRGIVTGSGALNFNEKFMDDFDI